jgi:hypothetical protein
MLGDMKLLDKLKTYKIETAKQDQSIRCKNMIKSMIKEFGKSGNEL